MIELRLKGTLSTGEPDWEIEVDGIRYGPEAIKGVLEWAHKVQFNTLDSILQERGLLALGESLVREPEETLLGDGWSLMVNPILRTQHILAGLKVPHLWAVQDEAEARRQLVEKMQKLGDFIWRERGRTRR